MRAERACLYRNIRDMKGIGLIGQITHWVIIALCLYAVFCCGFHLLPVWGYSENYESINGTLLSIALSYLAGYVIYLFTSWLPRWQRVKEVFALWSEHLSKLYNEMSERIEEVRVYVDIPKEKMEELNEEDAEALSTYTTLPPSIWLQKEVDRGESQPLRVQAPFVIKEILNRHYDAMKANLDVMLQNPMAVDAEKKLLDLLSRIKTSSFLSQCTGIIDMTMLKDDKVNITTTGLPKAYVEYVKLRDELGCWPFRKFVFKMRKMTDEEVAKSNEGMEIQLAKMGLTRQRQMEISQKLTNASW